MENNICLKRNAYKNCGNVWLRLPWRAGTGYRRRWYKNHECTMTCTNHTNLGKIKQETSGVLCNKLLQKREWERSFFSVRLEDVIALPTWNEDRREMAHEDSERNEKKLHRAIQCKKKHFSRKLQKEATD